MPVPTVLAPVPSRTVSRAPALSQMSTISRSTVAVSARAVASIGGAVPAPGLQF